jgi:hypothetical protein
LGAGGLINHRVNAEASPADPKAAHSATRLVDALAARKSLAKTTLKSAWPGGRELLPRLFSSVVIGMSEWGRVDRGGSGNGPATAGADGNGRVEPGDAAACVTWRDAPAHSPRIESEKVKLATGRS